MSGPNHKGVIGIDFQLNDLSEIISNSTIGEDGLVMLLNQNGTVIANQDNYLIESLFGEEYNEMDRRYKNKLYSICNR